MRKWWPWSLSPPNKPSMLSLIVVIIRLVSGVSSYGHKTGVAKIQEQVSVVNLQLLFCRNRLVSGSGWWWKYIWFCSRCARGRPKAGEPRCAQPDLAGCPSASRVSATRTICTKWLSATSKIFLRLTRTVSWSLCSLGSQLGCSIGIFPSKI